MTNHYVATVPVKFTDTDGQERTRFQRVRLGSCFSLTKNGQTIGRRSLTNAVIVVPGKTALRPRRGQRAVALHDQDHLR